VATVSPEGASAELATFGARAAASLIDALLIGLATSLVTASIGHGASRAALTVLTAGTMALLSGVYQTWCIGSSGATFGNRLTKTVVVDENLDGGVSFGRAALRFIAGPLVTSLAVLVPLASIYALGDVAAMFAGAAQQTLHDRLARTVVVKDQAER
jgi:uncharacterized RDD family membrane protein YckC